MRSSSPVLAAKEGQQGELIDGFTKPQMLHACRDVLRRLDRPASLRGNILLAASPFASVPQGVLRDELRQIITRALEDLSERQATIIRRCDMHYEGFALVASDLGISTRQLFRDRAHALAEITSRILHADVRSSAALTVAPSAVDTLVRSAEALVQCGNWRVAADMLENAIGSIQRPDERTRIRLSLGELYLEAGRVNLARQHIEAQIAAPAGSQWQKLYAQMLQARLSYSSGDARAAEAPLRRSIRTFRQLARDFPSKEALEGFARSLMIQSDLNFKLGKTVDAAAVSTEALDALSSVEDPDAFLSLATRTTAAVCRLFSWTDAELGQLELLRCYGEAIERGYLRESVLISTHLSGYYRLCNRLDCSLQIVNRAMPTARALGAGEALGGLLTEMGWALLMMGRYEHALSVLNEARSQFGSNRELEAVTDLLSARAWIASGRPDLALAAAEAVETTFTQMGRTRLAGASLIAQAEALQRLERVDAAYRTACVAFEVLQATLGKQAPAVTRAADLVKALASRPQRITPACGKVP
jgi:tetratricopeptide (TPR) repeat protein